MAPASPISVNAKAVKIKRIELVDVDNYVNRVFDTVGNATRSVAGNTVRKPSEYLRVQENDLTNSESSFSELRASTIHEYGRDLEEREEESNIVERHDNDANTGAQIVSSLKNNNLPSP